MDLEAFRINVLTSCFLERARIPIALPTDREVIEKSVETCWRLNPLDSRVVIIPSTLELETLWVSEAFEEEVRAHPNLKRQTEYHSIPFSTDGTLDQSALFPESVRAQRGQAR